MKILLISGHGAGDPGAIGNGYNEADLTVEMVKGIERLLKQYASVSLYPIERNTYADIVKGQCQVNFSNYDYVFEIHFNSNSGTPGTGAEVYVTTSEKTYSVESKVLDQLAALGFKNRGVKKTDFLVIKTAKNKGVSSALLETCFINNETDMKMYQSSKDKVYQAVTNGIIQGFGLSQTGDTTVSKDTNTSTSSDRNTSIVDYLKSIGTDSSFSNRQVLASQYGIANYTGTAEQNVALLNVMQNSSIPNNITAYYPSFTNTSIVDGLKSINVDSSMDTRKKIAVVNGISNYSGTAEQNTQLLSLAKQGKLKKV